MMDALASLIQKLLRLLGLRSINMQFFFSYSLIFVCAATTVGVLFLLERAASRRRWRVCRRWIGSGKATGRRYWHWPGVSWDD